MQFTANDLSLLLNGTIEGNPSVVVNKLAKIEEAGEGSVSFLANPKYEQYLYTTGASVVIVNNDQALAEPVSATLIRVPNAYSAITILLEQYNTIKLDKKGIEQPSFIHPSAVIGNDAYVGAFAYIGPNVKLGNKCKIYPNCFIADGVILGDNVTLFPGVKIYFDCVLGNNIIIHSGTVIGADGFGFAPAADGSYAKISQIGNVVIEDDVEIGANTTVDRATMGSTIIRKGVKLDNLVQIAHNVDIGANTVIAAQTGISGSTKVGENCIIGGQVGIAGHISIAKNTQIQAQSGFGKVTTEEGKKWMGSPAFAYSDHVRSQIVFRRLPALEKRIDELEKIIEQLKKSE
jgi:UDP-3-O-[3-hydroxymyristoyl] glucosamine N-acyltransferase